MKKIELLIRKIDGNQVQALAVVFDNDKMFEYTQLIDYSLNSTDLDILELLEEPEGDINSQLIGKRPPRRR